MNELPTIPGGIAAGSQIAGYTIEEQIGRGGMAVVYRASDRRLNRPVALKILAPELASDEGYRQRFLREMRAAAAVDHPNIVPVFDAGEADGALFIAMRYVDGQDVRTMLETEHRLPAARACHLIAQAASALDAAHARGLVHRDVKPGNMLIGSAHPDHLYLTDFGLSKQRASSAPPTVTGQFMGTLDYMAPEQIEGNPIDGRADLYALACTAFEMLAGQPPFKRDAGLAVMWAQVSAPVPSLRALRPDLPPAVDQVMATALAKTPDARYPTCMAFARALAAACGVGGEAGQEGADAPLPADLPAEQAQIPASRVSTSWVSDPQPESEVTLAGQRAADPQADAETAWAGRPMYRPDTAWTPTPDPDTATSARPPWSASPPPPGRSQPRGAPARPGRGRTWPVLVSVVVLLAIVGVAFALLRHNSAPGSIIQNSPPPTSHPATSATSATTAPVTSLGPAAAVRAYFAAINAHDYARAWALGGKNTAPSYSSFASGFNGTAKDEVTVVSVAGDVVTVKLAAVQTDGSVKHYQGTYTVANGVITQSQIQTVG
ncbi:MAG: protein kinase domain-containing protein [Streptosporangiaceae bacterium]